MSDSDPTHRPASRRDALNLMGGLAAAPVLIAGAAQAQSQPAGGPGAQPRPLVDPRNSHPKPPFPSQRQEWPGLAKAMNPRPDHGEESYRGSNRLLGRKALITGGDSGLGRAAAIAFAREGADVAIGYLAQEEEDARDVVALIRAAGRKAVALPGDIRDEAFCQRLVADAVQGLGGLDILCNNAARQHPHKSILDLTTEAFDWTLKTNLYAMFWITKAAVPRMPPGSAIINTASVTAWEAPAQLLDYASTKGGIVTFTKCLSKQLVERGIRVNAIAPGPFWTPLQPSGGQFPEELPKFGGDTPMKRPGQPAELAPVFVTLASQDATFTTGNVWASTGGQGAF